MVRGGKTVFVAGALPGERIRLRRTRRHRQHDDGELLEVLEPSGARVAPRCAHFGVCGGCALQHLAPAAQREAKQTELAETLARVARVQPARWLAPLAGPVWAYRRRARLGVKFVRKKGCVVVGFRERAAPYVAQLTRCEVLAAPVGELIAPLAAMLTELSIRERVPQIEVAVADQASALVLRVLSAPSEADTVRLRQFGAAYGVRLYLQPAGLDSVVPLDPPLEPLRYTLARSAVELEFAPVEFIQVNGAVNEALVERAAELLQLDSTSPLLDLYCGPHRACPRQRPSQRHRQRRISPRQPRDTTRRGACVDAPQLHPRAARPAAHRGAGGVGGAGGAGAAAGRVYFLSPGQSRARSFGTGARARLRAAGGGYSRHVSAHHAR